MRQACPKGRLSRVSEQGSAFSRRGLSGIARYVETGCAALNGIPANGALPVCSAQHCGGQRQSFYQALVTRDQRIYGRFLERIRILGWRSRCGPSFSASCSRWAPCAITFRLRSSLSRERHRLRADCRRRDDSRRAPVPFEDAIRALGLLLDRGLSPSRPSKKKAARALLTRWLKKCRRRCCVACRFGTTWR